MDKRLMLNGVLAALVLGACSLPFSVTPAPGVTLTPATPFPPTDTPAAPPPTEFNPCTVGGGLSYVVVIVDPRLTAGIRETLTRFENDICNESYAVLERRADFSTPADVRAYLIDLAGRVGDLSGALLIGEIPHAYQYVTLHSANPSIPSTSEEVISFQYYADLDGSFAKSAGYVSPGGHEYSFDRHEGAVDWEMWTGVLPIYKGDVPRTIEALNRYFDKNHAYRTAGTGIPPGFVEVSEFFAPATPADDTFVHDGLVNGEYAWTPFSSAPDAQIYFNNSSGSLTVEQGYAALTRGTADFTVLDAHGFYGASGALDIPWVESHPVATIFLWSNGCATGDLDVADNWLTAALYSPTSSVLVAKGTTNDSGGMGSNADGFFGHNIASDLVDRNSFGDAIRFHVNTPLLDAWAPNREFHFGSPVILGDPTLMLRR